MFVLEHINYQPIKYFSGEPFLHVFDTTTVIIMTSKPPPPPPDVVWVIKMIF